MLIFHQINRNEGVTFGSPGAELRGGHDGGGGGLDKTAPAFQVISLMSEVQYLLFLTCF